MTSPSRHPDFEALIRQARAQTAPPVKIGVEDVRRAAARRSSWRVASLRLQLGSSLLSHGLPSNRHRPKNLPSCRSTHRRPVRR